MTESAVSETATATPVKTPKKKATTPKAKSVPKKAPSTHPPTAQMVNNAIKNLKERGGSSLQAIKKYISSTYKVDAEKLSPFIKKYLKNSVDSGKLIRTKGKGASGSFKLATPDAKKIEKKPKIAKKPKTAAAKPKKPKTEKSAPPKKPKATTASKPKSDKPKAAAPKKKSPSKVKKTAKVPAAKKPKSPKPKKAAPKKPITKKPAAKK